MSDRITAENLDEVVAANKKIKKEIQNKVLQIKTNVNTTRISSAPQLALQLLRQYGLVQMPIENPYFGGAIFVREKAQIPFLNTAQPRANQHFTAWHEVYHLLFDSIHQDHIVESEDTVRERKADYFSSQMLLGDVMPYFQSLPEDDFVSNIFRCMELFQAPYKAVLISLYESASENGNETVMQAVRENINAAFSDIAARFQKLGLDDTLVKPSYIVNFAELSNKIKEAKKETPELTYHDVNEKFLANISREIKVLLGDRNG